MTWLRINSSFFYQSIQLRLGGGERIKCNAQQNKKKDNKKKKNKDNGNKKDNDLSRKKGSEIDGNNDKCIVM